VSYHGPHPATREFTDYSRDLLRRVLCDLEPAGKGSIPAAGPRRAMAITGGTAEGPLVGGNLSLVAATIGTPFAIQPRGAIVFLEEVGESAYRVDRLLTQLLLAGVFREAAGIAVGAFTETSEGDSGGQPAVEEVLRERLGGLGIPVAMGFPFGHIDDNWTLPMGVRARLHADAGQLELLEAAVG
jgi:muramoyltetrapeptide carboxypeptidase